MHALLDLPPRTRPTTADGANGANGAATAAADTVIAIHPVAGATPGHEAGAAAASTAPWPAFADPDDAPRQPWAALAAEHKALRHAMFSVLQALGTLDVAQPDAAAVALRPLQRLLDRLDEYRAAQTQVWLPALAARQAGVTHDAMQHHLDDLPLAAALAAQAADLRSAMAQPALAPRQQALAQLERSLGRFVNRQLQQMARDAQALHPLVEQLFSPAQRQALWARTQAALAPWQRLEQALAMADALGPTELAGLLVAQAARCAPAAWTGLALAVRGRVGESRWPAVSRAMADRLDGSGPAPAP